MPLLRTASTAPQRHSTWQAVPDVHSDRWHSSATVHRGLVSGVAHQAVPPREIRFRHRCALRLAEVWRIVRYVALRAGLLRRASSRKGNVFARGKWSGENGPTRWPNIDHTAGRLGGGRCDWLLTVVAALPDFLDHSCLSCVFSLLPKRTGIAILGHTRPRRDSSRV